MRLRNLFEAFGEEVAIIFGRFNPPHKGHRAAWELASKSPIWYVGTNESTVGPKDPLPYDVKVEAMKTVWPKVEGHIVAETSWLTLASKVYEKNPDATLLCLTDEDWVTKTIIQYNGKEGAHGFYNFKKIEQKPTPRLSSATALRDAVSKGDRDAFTQAAGVDADTPVAGKPFFDLVAEYLLPYANAPKKVVKKKAAAPAVAESLEEASYYDKFKFYHEGEMIGLIVPHTNGGAKTYRKFGPGRQQKVKLHDNEQEAKKWLIEKWKEQGVAEASLGNYRKKAAMQKAQSQMGAMFARDPAEREKNLATFNKREKGLSRLKARDEKTRKADQERQLADLVARLPELEAEYADMKQQYKALGGSNWQYADREQNLSPGERKARDMEGPMNNLWRQIQAAKKSQGMAEEGYGNHPSQRVDPRTGKRYVPPKSPLGKGVAEEAAGVGIITKQNSTVDVNKGTPRKNLKAFRLVK